MQQNSCAEPRDLISNSQDALQGVYRLTCGHCSKELINQVQDLITDAHGTLILKAEEEEQLQDHSCSPETALWYLKEGSWPGWIEQQIEESGWTKGRLCCFACKKRVGAFDFVSGGQCSCPEKQLKPAVQLTRARVDLKRLQK